MPRADARFCLCFPAPHPLALDASVYFPPPLHSPGPRGPLGRVVRCTYLRSCFFPSHIARQRSTTACACCLLGKSQLLLSGSAGLFSNLIVKVLSWMWPWARSPKTHRGMCCRTWQATDAHGLLTTRSTRSYRTTATAAATATLQLQCSYCSTPIAPRLVTGRALVAMQLQYQSSCRKLNAAAATRKLLPQCSWAARLTTKQDTGYISCSTKAAAGVQPPHSPWIGNRAGVVVVRLQHTSNRQTLAAAGATRKLQPRCGYCSIPIAPRLVTGRGLAVMRLLHKSSHGKPAAAAVVQQVLRPQSHGDVYRVGVGCKAAAAQQLLKTPAVVAAIRKLQLVQLPHSSSSGNGAGVVAEEVRHASSYRTLFATAAT